MDKKSHGPEQSKPFMKIVTKWLEMTIWEHPKWWFVLMITGGALVGYYIHSIS